MAGDLMSEEAVRYQLLERRERLQEVIRHSDDRIHFGSHIGRRLSQVNTVEQAGFLEPIDKAAAVRLDRVHVLPPVVAQFLSSLLDPPKVAQHDLLPSPSGGVC